MDYRERAAEVCPCDDHQGKYHKGSHCGADAIARALSAAAEEARPQECVWTLNDEDNHDYYDTTCGNAFTLTVGTPKENDYNHCPNCGGKIREYKQTERFVCPECGPGVKADEDGCCYNCGADCVVAPLPPEATHE